MPVIDWSVILSLYTCMPQSLTLQPQWYWICMFGIKQLSVKVSPILRVSRFVVCGGMLVQFIIPHEKNNSYTLTVLWPQQLSLILLFFGDIYDSRLIKIGSLLDICYIVLWVITSTLTFKISHVPGLKGWLTDVTWWCPEQDNGIHKKGSLECQQSNKTRYGLGVETPELGHSLQLIHLPI